MAGKKKESEEKTKGEKRTHIIQVILDDYERHEKDWKTFPDRNAAGNRSIGVGQELYDEIGKRELNRQVLELQSEGLLKDGRGKQSGWYTRGSELEKVVYRLQDIHTFYERDGRIPIYKRHFDAIREIRNKVIELRNQEVWKPWLFCCIEEMERQLKDEKIPTICKNEEKREIYFKTLAGLNALTKSMYRRVFSKRLLGSTKGCEKVIQDTIIADARKWNPSVDEDKEVMDDDTVLLEIGIETYHQNLEVKGPLKFELNGREIDTAAFSCGVILNADTMRYAKLLSSQRFRRVISIENKANFMMAPYEEDTLYVFSHGFFSRKEREFLRRLAQCVEENSVEYYHSSDLDYGGIRIFSYIQKKVFPDVKPLEMDAATFYRYLQKGEHREENYLKKIQTAEVPKELEELKNCILKTGCTIEQESMLYD